MRKPGQGVKNIVRFNWHFYLISFTVIILAFVVSNCLNTSFLVYLHLLGILVFGTTLVSLLVSFYVYDQSDLYNLTWLLTSECEPIRRIVNIHAGLDETSELLLSKFPNAEVVALDFYDPERHTEVSIKRARKAYPPFPNTQRITTSAIPLEESKADIVFIFLSAHEIRDANERLQFFRELRRIVKPSGQIIVVEHLRDIPNFLAYNIGFLHFHTKASWQKAFQKAGLSVLREFSITPFITTFMLKKNGTSS